MNETMARAATMRDAFDRIEEAYEFMLAYAAQGRKRETQEGAGESQIRQYLKRFQAALGDLEQTSVDEMSDAGAAAFADRFQSDIATVRSVIDILLSRHSITSDMIDNTNGLVAVRAFLTDVFFIDQVVLPPR
jgi:hypothetical protein